MMIPADAANPFLLDDILQRNVVADSVVKGRIAPDDERLKAEGGLKVSTLRGSVMTIKSDEGKPYFSRLILLNFAGK